MVVSPSFSLEAVANALPTDNVFLLCNAVALKLKTLYYNIEEFLCLCKKTQELLKNVNEILDIYKNVFEYTAPTIPALDCEWSMNEIMIYVFKLFNVYTQASEDACTEMEPEYRDWLCRLQEYTNCFLYQKNIAMETKLEWLNHHVLVAESFKYMTYEIHGVGVRYICSESSALILLDIEIAILGKFERLQKQTQIWNDVYSKLLSDHTTLVTNMNDFCDSEEAWNLLSEQKADSRRPRRGNKRQAGSPSALVTQRPDRKRIHSASRS